MFASDVHDESLRFGLGKRNGMCALRTMRWICTVSVSGFNGASPASTFDNLAGSHHLLKARPERCAVHRSGTMRCEVLLLLIALALTEGAGQQWVYANTGEAAADASAQVRMRAKQLEWE